jgi:hypothetical protein
MSDNINAVAQTMAIKETIFLQSLHYYPKRTARFTGRSQPGCPVGFGLGHKPGPISTMP